MSDNWVERRAAVEKYLAEGKREIWNKVRASIQDACESYKRNYGTREPYVTATLENGSRIRVDLPRMIVTGTYGLGQKVIKSIVVSYSSDVPSIDWADDQGNHQLKISSDENGAFVVDGVKRLSADEVSQKILEPVLFPKE
jgi:hypothetical protein